MFGVGADIESVARFHDVKVLGNEHFLDKVFTKAELADCRSKPSPAQSLAARFAGKEAVYKALSHFGRCRLAFKQIEIRAGRGGVPSVKLKGFAVKLSLSHCATNALAFAVAVRRP